MWVVTRRRLCHWKVIFDFFSFLGGGIGNLDLSFVSFYRVVEETGRWGGVGLWAGVVVGGG